MSRRGVLALVAAAPLALIVGCTLLVDLDGLANPTSVPDAGPSEGGSGAHDADVRDVAAPDARREEDGSPVILEAGPDVVINPGKTRVSCQEPSSCADREGCCVVYGGASDFCTAKPTECKFGTSSTVFVPCDDANDCAALGKPGMLCCADADNGVFFSVSCRPAGQCPVQLCDAVEQACPAGKTCKRGVYAAETWVCD